MIILFEKFNNDITYHDLKKVKDFADKYFNQIGLDVKFTKHFIDRINDSRNKPKITIDELSKIFKEVYEEYGQELKMHKDDYTAVIKDMTTDINTPFVLDYNWDSGEIDIILKTIMRKKDFKTSTDIYPVETEEEFPDIFNHTIYRIPSKEELLEFENYPNMKAQDIVNGFYYTIVGRGILDSMKKSMIIESIKKLIDIFHSEKKYKEALNIANDIKIKIFESPDSVEHKNLELYFGSYDAAIFGYYNGKFRYYENTIGEKYTHIGTHGRDRSEWDYPGRLWKNSKVITFWIYPSYEEFKEIINELENRGLNIWNNGWRIEVIENYKYEFGYEWNNFDYNLELIPVENYKEYWEEYKIIQYKKKDIEKEHELSPLLKNKKFVKGFGTDSPKGKQPLNWKQALLKSEKLITKFKDFII